jgi:hypothetical protein
VSETFILWSCHSMRSWHRSIICSRATFPSPGRLGQQHSIYYPRNMNNIFSRAVSNQDLAANNSLIRKTLQFIVLLFLPGMHEACHRLKPYTQHRLDRSSLRIRGSDKLLKDAGAASTSSWYDSVHPDV